MILSYPASLKQGESYRGAVIASIALHAIVLLALSLNFDLFKKGDSVFRAKVIDAVVVDSSVLDALDREKRQQEQLQKQQQAAEQKRRREAERIRREKLEQQRLAKEKKRQEQIHLAEQKKLEEQKRLAEQKKLEEQKRLAEQKKREEEKRLREQARLEEERRLLQKAQQQEWEKLQAEEHAAAEQARSRELANNMDLYKQAITQRVKRNWIRPVSAEDGYTCIVIVDQIPGGEVVNVDVQNCDGDAVFQRSVRNAVYKSSPLPDPPNPALFDRRIRFTFEVEEKE